MNVLGLHVQTDHVTAVTCVALLLQVNIAVQCHAYKVTDQHHYNCCCNIHLHLTELLLHFSFVMFVTKTIDAQKSCRAT